MEHKCPLCGRKECFKDLNGSNDFFYDCYTFNRIFHIGSTIEQCKDGTHKRRMQNLLFEQLIKSPGNDSNDFLYFSEGDSPCPDEEKERYVNLSDIAYPATVSEKIDRALMNLYRCYPNYSDLIRKDPILARALFSETEADDEYVGFIYILKSIEYLEEPKEDVFRISAAGWRRIDKLSSKGDNKQAFIAGSFSGNSASVLDVLKNGVRKAGYDETVIETDGDNRVIPEVFYEIDRSEIVVVDVSFSDSTAYYEAGYALGKGKKLIVCCRKAEYDSDKESRPGFDAAMKSVITWDSEEDLAEKLIRRIEALS